MKSKFCSRKHLAKDENEIPWMSYTTSKKARDIAMTRNSITKLTKFVFDKQRSLASFSFSLSFVGRWINHGLDFVNVVGRNLGAGRMLLDHINILGQINAKDLVLANVPWREE